MNAPMAVERKGVRCSNENARNAVSVSIHPHTWEETLERRKV